MVVVMVTAAVRVVFVISTNLFNCILFVLVVVVLLIGVVVVLLLLTTSIPTTNTTTTTTTTNTTPTTFTTSFTTSFTTHHTFNYGTSDDGGISDIGLVVMVVGVMVRYLGCWWYSDVDGGDDSL